jgi:hypothetical protein
VILGVSAHTVGMWFLGAGLVLTTWSGLDYFFRFIGELFKYGVGPRNPPDS